MAMVIDPASPCAGERIVIGLGSGRSGTASLTSLLDRQAGGVCFHEMNPSCAVFHGNPQPQINAVVEFGRLLDGGERNRLCIDYSRPSSVRTYERLQRMPRIELLGDVAFYYLAYVEELLRIAPGLRFVCIKRDRDLTVESWLEKSTIKRWRSLWLADRLKSLITGTPFHGSFNYWQVHDGSRWRIDPVWDSCFPKFEAASKADAIGMYWDFYYQEAERLQQLHRENFRIFDIGDLSDSAGQRRILAFVGVAEDRMVHGGEAHLHRSKGLE